MKKHVIVLTFIVAVVSNRCIVAADNPAIKGLKASIGFYSLNQGGLNEKQYYDAILRQAGAIVRDNLATEALVKQAISGIVGKGSITDRTAAWEKAKAAPAAVAAPMFGDKDLQEYQKRVQNALQKDGKALQGEELKEAVAAEAAALFEGDGVGAKVLKAAGKDEKAIGAVVTAIRG